MDQIPDAAADTDPAASLDNDPDVEAASSLDGEEIAAVAQEVPNDEEVAVAIRMRDSSDSFRSVRARSVQAVVRAVVFDAQPVLHIETSGGHEVHPHVVNRRASREIQAYHCQRNAFRACVLLILLLGVGLGLGLGIGLKNRDSDDSREPPIRNTTQPDTILWNTTLAPGEACANDPSWKVTLGMTCEAVAANPLRLCTFVSRFNDPAQPVKAYEACRQACTTCDGIDPTQQLVPLRKPDDLECIDNNEWQSFLDHVNCEFVATKPETFCGFVGKESLELAFRACPVACFQECRGA